MAPLLIGVTGKLDLKGADEAVRAALSLAFDRLDARCPGTPKVLLSALAKGADTVAAEAALARPGWSVVAPLPFSADLYLEDFDAAAGARLRGLLANPRVRALVVEPLRKRDGGKPFSDPELSRSSEDGSARTDHYEQVGLFIAERAAILIAVMEAAEPPGKIGGSARIVHHRLTGELDADTIRVVRRSEVLLEPPRLADRHTGPVWVVDLDRLDRNPGAPADALLVWNPGDAGPAPLGAKPATTLSLTLADGVEGFNRRVSRLSGPAWKALEARAGPHRGDAASQLRRLRIGLSLVQGEMIRRVRRSIRQLAWLSLATILMFEIYVDLGSRDFYLDLDRFAWAPLACVAYIVLLLAAVFIYWHAGRQRWQRIAEDYRAAAEALRVQLAWWESGLTGRDDRIERFYQHGARGSVQLLRTFVDQLMDGCALCFDKPVPDPGAATAWAAEEVRFYDVRIVERRRELVVVEGASWFCFAASLGVGLSLPFTLVFNVILPFFERPDALSVPLRLLLLAGAAALIVGLLLVAIRARGSAEERETDPNSLRTAAPVWAAGIAAGLILTVGLCVLATFVEPPGARLATSHATAAMRATMKWAKELIAIAVVMPAAIAGALRFVADKSSWSAELAGYEHTRAHFRRGQAAMEAAGPFVGAAAGEQREIILALGAEALAENENWLRAHRERPLEPIVGG